MTVIHFSNISTLSTTIQSNPLNMIYTVIYLLLAITLAYSKVHGNGFCFPDRKSLKMVLKNIVHRLTHQYGQRILELTAAIPE